MRVVYGHEKEYRFLVARHPDAGQIETWRRGVVLEDGYGTVPAQVRAESLSGKGAWPGASAVPVMVTINGRPA